MTIPHQRKPAPRRPSVTAVGHAVDRALLEPAVVRARLQGASWADMGRALGVTPAAAHKRFRDVDLGLVGLVVDVDEQTGRRHAHFRSTRLDEPLGPGPAFLDRALQLLAAAAGRPSVVVPGASA